MFLQLCAGFRFGIPYATHTSMRMLAQHMHIINIIAAQRSTAVMYCRIKTMAFQDTRIFISRRLQYNN